MKTGELLLAYILIVGFSVISVGAIVDATVDIVERIRKRHNAEGEKEMELRKCDKCGWPFDATKHKDDIIVMLKGYNEKKFYGLCPRCTKELLKWMKEGDKGGGKG